MLIWDVSKMGAAQSPQQKAQISQCASNHMYRIGVDLENQILFNMLCQEEGGPAGVLKTRKM
jgi:hypothetical protein